MILTFILCISFLAFQGLVKSAILTGHGSSLSVSARELSKEEKISKWKINQEKDRLVSEKLRNFYRANSKNLLDKCLNQDLVKKYVTRSSTQRKPGQSKIPDTEEERQQLAEEAVSKMNQNCIVKYLRGDDAGHPDWSTQKGCLWDFFAFLQLYHHFTQSCSDLVVELKNYNNMLKPLNKNLHEQTFFICFKTFYFKCADALKQNEILYKHDMVNPLIANTVVSINAVSGSGSDSGRYVSGTASGNLVSFNPRTNKFNNLCTSGDKKVSLNYLLTALHCLNGWEALIFPEKGNRDLVNPAINVYNPVALIPMKTHIESFNKIFERELKNAKDANAANGTPNKKIDENEVVEQMLNKKSDIDLELKNLIMTEPSFPNDPRELRSEIPFLAGGTKVIGEDVIVNLFQDQDAILVKLDKPIMMECKGGKTLDFSHGNVDQNVRDQVLRAVQNKNSILNLYGFPGSQGPYRIKMGPLKRELIFPDDRPERAIEAFNEGKEIAIKGFTLNGAALNGASGGPLFWEDNANIRYVATIIRGSEHNLNDLEVKFNARSIPKE